MNQYEYNVKDGRHNKLFNKAMVAHTVNNLKRIVEVYNGFEKLKEILDVGGGIGTLSSLICSKYPTIRCINFDLPHVIENSPSYPGMKSLLMHCRVSLSLVAIKNISCRSETCRRRNVREHS